MLAADPAGIAPGAAPMTIVGAGSLVALVALLVAYFRRSWATSDEDQQQHGSIFWLTLAAATGIAGQALFFFLMARPLNGLHYAQMLPGALVRRPAGDAGGESPASSRRHGRLCHRHRWYCSD